MEIKNTKSFLEFCKDVGINDVIPKKPTYKFKKDAFNNEIDQENQNRSNLSKKNDISRIELIQNLKTKISSLNTNLRDTSTNLVFSEGNIFSKIMLIGEAPGTEEDRHGIPFLGKSGKLLYKILGYLGLNKKNLYLTNLIFWRPPGNRTPKKEEVQICLPYTFEHIRIINPEFIIFLGGLAAKKILKINENIIKLRGQEKILEFNEKKIPTLTIYHPSFLINNPIEKKQTWLDLTKIHSKLKKFM